AVPDNPARAPVVLVPGFTGSKEDFSLLLAPLAAAGHHAVALDLRGQHESTGPSDPGAYGLEALAAEVLAVAATLHPGPVHVVGHSFGGLVARAAVLARPTAVRSLVLMSSGPAALTGPRVSGLDVLRPLLASDGLPAVVDAIEAIAANDPLRPEVPAELRAFLRARLLASSPVGLEVMAEALTTEPDRVEELRESGVPVLVLYGERDDAWLPSEQAAMAARLGADQAVIPGAAHSPAVENAPATVRAILDFLAAVP
ncbi:MAG TPA: alpha/beta hydrolase, partial [Mycobacteriales bacterium]|nr:alpha/beta hydrolase [Mycobacteriales bacterium]